MPPEQEQHDQQQQPRNEQHVDQGQSEPASVPGLHANVPGPPASFPGFRPTVPGSGDDSNGY